MTKRFTDWKYPEIKDGITTKYNWLVQNLDGFILGKKSIMVIDTGGTKEIGEKLFANIRKINKLKNRTIKYSYKSNLT